MEGRLDDIPFEYTVRVLRFKRYLPAGPATNGGYRKQDLVEVFTDPGGLRTLALSSIGLGRRRKRKQV